MNVDEKARDAAVSARLNDDCATCDGEGLVGPASKRSVCSDCEGLGISLTPFVEALRDARREAFEEAAEHIENQRAWGSVQPACDKAVRRAAHAIRALAEADDQEDGDAS